MVEHSRTMGGDNFCWVSNKNGTFTTGDTIVDVRSNFGVLQSNVDPLETFHGTISVDCDFEASNVTFAAKDCVMSNVTYYERVTYQVIDEEEYKRVTLFNKHMAVKDGDVYKRKIREESSTPQSGFEARTREVCTYPGTTSNVVHDFRLTMLDKDMKPTEDEDACAYKAAYVPFT